MGALFIELVSLTFILMLACSFSHLPLNSKPFLTLAWRVWSERLLDDARAHSSNCVWEFISVAVNSNVRVWSCTLSQLSHTLHASLIVCPLTQ